MLKDHYDKWRKVEKQKTKMGWGAVVSILIILAYIINTQNMTDFSGSLGFTAAVGGIIIFGIIWRDSRREASRLHSNFINYSHRISHRLKDIGVSLSHDGQMAYLRNEDGSLGSGFDPFDDTSFE